ncbi:MAG: ATP-binding protein [Anaerolineae bacterium]|nr:ATP-binding protein [Anaerolineae bacterium]
MFVNREQELAFLNSLPSRRQPGPAQLILLYGRRRVGKTVLARHWADSTSLPTTYWAAEPEPAALQRRKLYARMLDVTMTQAPLFGSWADLWTGFAKMLGGERRVLILDEIPYAAEADPAFLSSIQHAWDQQFKKSRLVLLLSGSHVHTMETLLARGSPLFGRFTGQWHLQPLEYSALSYFVPKWKTDERVALYAIVGGVPAYLEWLKPDLSLVDNIREVILAPGGLFLAEPELLLYDEVREPRMYRAVLQAIGNGAHTLDEIANAALIGKTHLSSYLARLQELGFVERRLPVTIPPSKQFKSRMGRYHLTDAFLRFYFRFIAPQRAELGFQPDAVLAMIKQHLRGFVGNTAFEQLSRLWLARQSQQKQLSFSVQHIGSHWSREAQVDVVGINWQEKEILLGECRWGKDVVSRETVVELIETKTPRVLRALPDAGKSWTVHFGFFSRGGLTPAALAVAHEHQAVLVDLAQLDRDLRT